MVKNRVSCVSLPVNKPKSWPPLEYYIGERDEEDRKHGKGENHWTSAYTMEWYTGQMFRDTMHGLGEYRWRYTGPEGDFTTHEGQFYVNKVHGYGVSSYPDGRVSICLAHSDVRWGPAIERHSNHRADVGFWSLDQLVRLAWKPSENCVVPNMTYHSFVKPFRTVLARNVKIIGETNSAIELLKQAGADPRVAAEKWPKMYTKNCTDQKSLMCQVDLWTRDYYKGKIQYLEEKMSDVTEDMEQENRDDEDDTSKDPQPSANYFYAWNNSQMMVHMMKHCYTHEKQRKQVELSLEKVLNGPRKHFPPPSAHEKASRMLLMACYLGRIVNVLQLINEHYIHPNVADIQGNSPLMYAVCGNHDKIINFLVEAGGDVNGMNDSCLTPLAVAIIYYICNDRDISAKDMIQCLLPPNSAKSDEKISEWLINRNMDVKPASPAPGKSLHNIKNNAKSTVEMKPFSEKDGYDSEDSFDEDLDGNNKIYSIIKQEYEIKVNEVFLQHKKATAAKYIFEVRDLVNDALLFESEDIVTKIKKEPTKPAKEPMNISKVGSMANNANNANINNKRNSLDLNEKFKQELLAQNMQSILQLLSDGADPRLVKCPQPALFLAVTSGNPDLIRHLVHYGADVNEIYPETLDYTALDIAVALPFTDQNFELIRALLESGANPNHRLKMHVEEDTQMYLESMPMAGPTLFHAVINRKTETEDEEDNKIQVCQLLLQHNCDPLPRFNGSSVIDNAMTQNLDHLDLFIESPAKIDLNATINDNNQTILVKLFSGPYFANHKCTDLFLTLTNLLLYGADPLIECQNGDAKYGNVYQFAKKTLCDDFGYLPPVPGAEEPQPPTLDMKSKNQIALKQSKSSKLPSKSLSIKAFNKLTSDKAWIKCNDETIMDYIEALQLMTQCGRILHVRWIQSNLMRELVDIIKKFKHRHWSMIIKEHKNKKCCALWLTTDRCLDMWTIFKKTRIPVYHDETVFKHLLSIVLLYNNRTLADKLLKFPVTTEEKNAVDSHVTTIIREHKVINMIEIGQEWKKKYVKPELCPLRDPKFNVCFNCALPLQSKEENIPCSRCKLVSFCNLECMRMNISLEDSCHPCSEYLLRKHFTPPVTPTTEDDV